MRYLHTSAAAPIASSQELTTIRDQLTDEIRTVQGKTKKGRGKATTDHAQSAESVDKARPLNFGHAFDLALTSAAAVPSTTHSSYAIVTSCVLAFDVVHLLLQRSSQLLPSNDLEALYTVPFLTHLADTIYAAWDSGPSALVQRCRESLQALLDLSAKLPHAGTAVAQHLRARLLVDPWNTKRTLNTFKAIVAHLPVEAFAAFSSGTTGESVPAGVLRRITYGMAASDPTATLGGDLAMTWIEKCWAEGADERFFVRPVADAIKLGERGRKNVPLYLLIDLFRRRKSAFRELMSQGGFLLDETAGRSTEELEAALALLKVGNAQGLVAIDAAHKAENAAPNMLALPRDLLETCLTHASPSLRCAALSILVIAPSTSLAIPTSTWPLVRSFYVYSLGTEDPEFQMASTALSGRLLLRLRDSAWKAQRRIDKQNDPVATAYVEEVKDFLIWWSHDLLSRNLNPAKPFRIKMNALKLLDLVLQANVDVRFSAIEAVPLGPTAEGKGYALHRRSAPASTPQFTTKHRKIDLDSAMDATSTSAWPFQINIVTAQTTFTLLTTLQSTYTALRALSISLLEHFPSPLPGYDGADGSDKVREELLVPALKLVRSGRESEASAGAGVIGLVWRKWVLESGVQWDLGQIGGWTAGSAQTSSGPVGFAFLNSLMDLAEFQLGTYTKDLVRAASSTPMHGTLLALRHLFASVPLPAFETLATEDERRELFARALAIVERVWDVTAPVLAASAPEGASESTIADTEEARAIRFEEHGEGEAGEVAEEADGHGGPTHKIILSATWRAMKEAGELLETIVRLPSELGALAFQTIWSLERIEHIGELFAAWLARIRHRGAFMALAPCYSRACGALLLCKGWPEVQALPLKWLNSHLDAIISQKISITRRSAGIPYCILGLLTVILPTDKAAFDRAFLRLFEIAESKTSDILDESRVHAMNTLRTAFLDAKTAGAVAPYVERGFLLSISMFWSSNWICRNVAMMTYAALVTRSFGSKRTNLSRDALSLSKRMTAADFFGRYPQLHAVLREELEYSSREHLNDLPTSDLHSSLFSVLMLLSLLQTTNRLSAGDASPSDAFVPIVRACASSRVWKIRDAAGDALTGLVPPTEVASVCADVLTGVATLPENETHGRLVQVLRLLEGCEQIPSSSTENLFSVLSKLAPDLSGDKHSFAVRTTFLSIMRTATVQHGLESLTLSDSVCDMFDESRLWPATVAHVPSAEYFVTAAFAFILAHESSSPGTAAIGLSSPFLEVQRVAIEHVKMDVEQNGPLAADLSTQLLELAQCATAASECRISALEILASSSDAVESKLPENTFDSLVELRKATVIVPLQEALLPLIARLAGNHEDRLNTALEIIESASGPFESIESREAAASALCQLQTTTISHDSRFIRILLRLVQDDDVTVRGYVGAVVSRLCSNGVPVSERRGVELITRQSPVRSLEHDRKELDADIEALANPSSLLFAVEKPNIFKDDLLENEIAPYDPTSSLEQYRRKLSDAVKTSRTPNGPLGWAGNEIYCKLDGRICDSLNKRFEYVL